MKQDIEFNGKKASDFKVYISEPINIPCPLEKYTEHIIAGKDGTLIEKKGKYDDIKITVRFNYKEIRENGEIYRNVKNSFLSRTDGKLKINTMSDYFYVVKRVEIETETKKMIRTGEFEVIFTCDPFTYLESGLQEQNENNLYNSYYISHPIYKIAGEGVCNLTVNGKTMKANISGNLTINTDLMISYREDGTMQNTSVTGDYEELYLLPGDNTIELTNGFSLSVIPNWRCF